VPTGETGEVLVRSPQNVVEGWLRTGDLSRTDADGYLYPMGRLSDTINRGGEKFGPVEVESVLRRHPAVVDVGVTGVHDPEMGERVGAVVVLGPGDGGLLPTAEDLRRFCRSDLAAFKAPEVVVIVDRLPYNDLGKVSRAALARVISEAGQSPGSA
jgi:long-chain acyl-CoA synthetase